MRSILPRLLASLLLAGALAGGASGARAKEAAPAADDPVLEAKLWKIAIELRCLVCQNQTIADSHADLAVDLRNQVRDMLRQGRTNQEIIDYMTARYGDFVLYRPPVKRTTWLLWFGPAVFMVGGVAVLFLVLRGRSRLAADAFEPDQPEAGDEAGPAAPARPAATEPARTTAQ
jgi:cytochrome c-type biogenesis protein CcmH